MPDPQIIGRLGASPGPTANSGPGDVPDPLPTQSGAQAPDPI